MIYRDEPLAVEDYDEVIRNLSDAREQLFRGELWRGCAYCGSEEHNPNECRHNPIVQARAFVQKTDDQRWRCFHCGEVFAAREEDAARCHFGLSIAELPNCVSLMLLQAGVSFVTFEDEGETKFVLSAAADESAVSS